MNASDVRSALLEIDEVVRSETFEHWRKAFVRRHIDDFTYQDENKLIYTEIHQKYEEGVESRIAEGMPKGFDMAAFMSALPAYLEGPGKEDEATGKAVQMLLEVGDFQQFKEMMMFIKKEEIEGESKSSEEQLVGITTSSSDVAAFDVDGMMHMAEDLARAADAGEGWVNMLELDWMKIDKMVVPEKKRKSASDIYLRGVWTMGMTFEECCDMMFTFNERRKKWDTNFQGVEFPFGKHNPDDFVASAKLSFGYLINLVMFGASSGTTLTTRNLSRWDEERRSVTYAMVPWNIETNSIDDKHKLLSLKTGTISMHPTIRDKCVMTTLEINGMGSLPDWGLSFMMRQTAPSMMRGLEQRYLKEAKARGDFEDVTPWGRDGGGGGGGGGEEKSSRK